MFIINAIKKIKSSKRILFTTPTHLNSGIIPFSIRNLIGKKVFYSDYSEIDGLDNLKKPQECIFKSQQCASRIYNTKQTFYLTNGSSSGILALMMSVLEKNDKVIIARNAHESVINGLILTGATPIWLLPEHNYEFDIPEGITLSQVKSIHSKNKDVKALIITSPTYEGVCSEIKQIGEFCKKNNIIFIVDEAHGALYPFSNELPDDAITLGADASVQSLHKNTPSLTGTALLHIGKNSSLNVDIVQRNLNIISTTSPSWIMISSIEAAIEFLNSKRCKNEITELIGNINKLISENPNCQFLTKDNHDITKLIISKIGYSGEELSDKLFEHNIEDELSTGKSVLCLCGIGTTKKKLKKLSNVLNKIENKKIQSLIEDGTYSLPEQKLSPQEAYNSCFEEISPQNAVGRIIAENITPYPPCIPVLIMGEVIEEKHIKYITDTKVKVIK